jgi:hypothetical protein
MASGRRSRTRDAIDAVRHVFLDADSDGPAVLSRVNMRGDLPNPSYVLQSSPNFHLLWRVIGFDASSVERLQKQLASELQTDPAATPVTQNTRLPGFFNHKRAQPHLVTIEYRNVDVRYRTKRLSAAQGNTLTDSGDRTARASGIRCANHRTSEAIRSLRAARSCRSARRVASGRFRRPHCGRCQCVPSGHTVVISCSA